MCIIHTISELFHFLSRLLVPAIQTTRCWLWTESIPFTLWRFSKATIKQYHQITGFIKYYYKQCAKNGALALSSCIPLSSCLYLKAAVLVLPVLTMNIVWKPASYHVVSPEVCSHLYMFVWWWLLIILRSPGAVLALFGPSTPQTLLQLPEELRKHSTVTFSLWVELFCLFLHYKLRKFMFVTKI